MLLEYLVGSEKKVDIVLNIASDYPTSKKKLIGDYFIVAIEIESNSEDTARKLSDLNENIVSTVSPTVLTNGAAAYYNKILFPFVNDFERKLRKLLYAASALKPSEKNTIGNLEEQDFGTIFDALFLDRDYWNKVKTYVNGKNQGWSGYSYELHAFLRNATENLLWDRLLPNQVPLLRKQFSEIRFKRNDIMHAHNINKAEFKKARKLFEDVNHELDAAIEKLADGALIPDTYNKEIDNAVNFVAENGNYLTDNEGNRLIIE